MIKSNGGIIGPDNVTTGGAFGTASGVFKLGEVTNLIKESKWPTAGPQGFQVANSCRFNDGSSDYMLKTASAGNRRTFTFSTWLKLSQLTTARYLFTSWSANNDAGFTYLSLTDGDKIKFAGYGTTYLETTQVLRDPSAWYNLVLAVDTTSGTANNRCRIYLNGSEITSFGTRNNPSQDADLAYNQNSVDLVLGSNNYGGSKGNYFDGYLAETVWIDGTQYAASDFGEFNSQTGIWVPKVVTGLTFGTNGFYLDFKDSANLGNDANGGTDLTEANLTSLDQTTDTCSTNFATWNPLDQYYFWGAAASTNITDGNTIVQSGNSQYGYIPTTIGVNIGKYYWEIKPSARNGGTGDLLVGVTSTQSVSAGQTLGYYPNDVAYRENGNKKINNSDTSYGNSYTLNDIIGVAMDLDNNKLYFSKNGTWQNSGDPESGATGTGAISLTASASTGLGNYFASVAYVNGSYNATFQANFGNPAYAISSGNTDGNGFGNFEYAVPSGYLSLNTKNLAAVLA